ncbi:MAG: GNAT family N-acetyltransferase [Acidimicrobiales bacterium]|nr:GNAT family N-acetyltransferase [Acidimicrobiales bacterium]
MSAPLMIRPPRPAELKAVQQVEIAAGRLFADVGMDLVARHDPFSLFELQGFLDRGSFWVATPVGGDPVAYLLVEEVDGCAHVEQVSVHPDHAGQGVGARLIDTAEGWAAARGLPALTLTTFAEVAWNRPYYERLGFRVLADAEITPGLAAIRTYEASIGIDAWPRVCMRREVGAPRPA